MCERVYRIGERLSVCENDGAALGVSGDSNRISRLPVLSGELERKCCKIGDNNDDNNDDNDNELNIVILFSSQKSIYESKMAVITRLYKCASAHLVGDCDVVSAKGASILVSRLNSHSLISPVDDLPRRIRRRRMSCCC